MPSLEVKPIALVSQFVGQPLAAALLMSATRPLMWRITLCVSSIAD